MRVLLHRRIAGRSGAAGRMGNVVYDMENVMKPIGITTAVLIGIAGLGDVAALADGPMNDAGEPSRAYRRFTARASTRPGRLPTTCAARLSEVASIRSVARASSLKTMTSQLAAIDCMAAVKLRTRGNTPASSVDCSMVRRIRL